MSCISSTRVDCTRYRSLNIGHLLCFRLFTFLFIIDVFGNDDFKVMVMSIPRGRYQTVQPPPLSPPTQNNAPHPHSPKTMPNLPTPAHPCLQKLICPIRPHSLPPTQNNVSPTQKNPHSLKIMPH